MGTFNIEALENHVENTKIIPKKSKNSTYFQGTEALQDFLTILTYLVMKEKICLIGRKEFLDQNRTNSQLPPYSTTNTNNE